MEYLEKSESFEHFLDRLNATLENEFPSRPVGPPRHAFAQIVGLPRSGTTILFQLLARTGVVGYPSNVMAPYWRVPVVGARLQRQLAQSKPTVSMHSVAGRTREPLDPHEFGYFWRHALGHSSNTLHPDLEGWSWDQLQAALDSICEAFDAPTVHKNFLALGHGAGMRHHLRRSKFIVLARDPRDVAASLWSVRQKIEVPEEATFGLDPGVDEGDDLAHRIIAQVRTLEAARRAFIEGDHDDTMVVDYTTLCQSPREVVRAALEFLEIRPTEDAFSDIPPTLPSGKGRDAAPKSVVDPINSSFLGGS